MGNFCETLRTEPTFNSTVQESVLINATSINIKSGNILDESDTIVIFVTPYLNPLNGNQKAILDYFLPSIEGKIEAMKANQVLSYGTSVIFKIEEEDNFEWVCLTVLPLHEDQLAQWFLSLRESLERREITTVSMPFITIKGLVQEQLAHSFISIIASSINNLETHSFLERLNLYCNEGVLLKTLSRELSRHSDNVQPLAKKRVNSYEREIIGFSFHKDNLNS